MEDDDRPGTERPAWQVFQWEDVEGPPLDGRDRGQLRYVGRIVKPEDEFSTYWKPDEAIVGGRFGEGQYVIFADEAILGWEEPSDYSRREPIWLDVVADTRYKPREAAKPS